MKPQHSKNAKRAIRSRKGKHCGRKSAQSSFLAATLLAFTVAHDSAAQTSSEAPDSTSKGRQVILEEVIVTASRREESLLDTAASMSVLGASDLEDRGLTDFVDIKKAVAGLHLEMNGDMNSAQVRLRGVGLSPRSGGLDPAVGILVDNVPQIRFGAAFSEMLDVERIEVLRGPQGTSFGKNTTAGVIHIHTKDPDTQAFSGRVQGVAGNLDTRELRGMINVPLVQDSLALRLIGFTTETDGHSKNIHLDEDTQGRQDREGGRAKLLWSAADNLDVQLRSEINKHEGRFDNGFADYGVDDTTGTALRGQPWEVHAAALGRTLPAVEMGRTAFNGSTFQDDIERHVLTVDWSFLNHNLKSITAYEQVEANLNQDGDGTPLRLRRIINKAATRSRSQEFLLSNEGTGPLTYVAGLFYQEEKLRSPTDVLVQEDEEALGTRSRDIVSTTKKEVNTRAVFGNVTYALTDEWSVVGGVRYTSDKKEQFGHLDLGGGREVTTLDDSETFDEWAYTAKVKYFYSTEGMAYLSLDRGFKTGGFNRQDVRCLLGVTSRCLTPDQISYDTETTDSVELGVKTEWWDNRIQFTGAVFYQTYDDYQVNEVLANQANNIIRNAAKVDSKGVELDLVVAVTDNLRVDGSFAWMEVEYDKFERAPCAFPTAPRCQDTNNDGRNDSQDLSGEQLDNAPKLSGNLGVEYRSNLIGQTGLQWFGRVDMYSRSDANLNILQPPRTEQGGYTLYSARLGLEPTDRQWGITVWGNNLGDKDYAVVGDEDLNGLQLTEGRDRTYGATLDWRF